MKSLKSQLSLDFEPKPKKPLVWTIYCHTNTINGKCYVGQTRRSMKWRWNRHVGAAKRGSDGHFHSAIRKYGACEFEHVALELCQTLCAANDAERRWIAHFGSNNPAVGYNMESGGYEAGRLSSETRAKMSASGKRRWEMMSAEDRAAFHEKIADATTGRSTEERREASRAVHADRTPGERRARMSNALATLTAERRSENSKACAERGWATRRANAAALAASVASPRPLNLTRINLLASDRRKTNAHSDKVWAARRAHVAEMSPEEKAADAAKVWTARRANAAKRLADQGAAGEGACLFDADPGVTIVREHSDAAVLMAVAVAERRAA